MRHWLRLPMVQLIVASYPKPYEHIEVMLKIWEGDHNNTSFLAFMSIWINLTTLSLPPHIRLLSSW